MMQRSITMPDSSPPISDVSTPHPDFTAADPAWCRIRDVLAGSDSVKAAGYLPCLAGHDNRPDLAAAYAQRAVFVGFAARTIDALTGAIFRKEGGVKVPKRYEPRLANLNNQGDQLYNFAKKVVREVISYGRFGLLVDVSTEGAGTGPLDFIPYVSGYSAQSITNWRTRIVGGRPVLDQVILSERREEPQEFGSVLKPFWRVLEIDQDGLYKCRIIEKHNDEWITVQEVYPTDYRNRKLDYIPFVFISPVDLSPNIAKSPILDLVDVNISHYRTSADLEQGRYYTSQPTPVILGVPEDNQGAYARMTIGSGSVWLMPPSVSDVRMLEYTGDGLGSLERALDQKERYMSQLGARLLAEPKRTAEAAETVRLKNTAETSSLVSIARTSADGIRTAIEMSSKWAGIEGKIEFELNQDFVDATMDPQMLAELIRAWQGGAMPLDDLFWNLQRGEMVKPGSTFESFRGSLEIEGPQFSRPSLRLINGPDDEDGEG
jgi:hypothetical protein